MRASERQVSPSSPRWLRWSAGAVSRASLGTVKRLGDEFVSSGAWIEVMLNDGKSAADHLRLLEGEWDEMEILGY